MRVFALGIAFAIGGCSTATSLVVKPPVVSKCEEAGLKGCDDLADGVILYVEGDKKEGEKKLRAGVAKNSSTRVRRYAALLKVVASLPQLGSYGKAVGEVCDLLADETGGALAPEEEKAAKAEAKPKGDEAGDARGVGATGLRTSTVVPAANPLAYTCAPFGAFSTPQGAALCQQVTVGPLIITDVQVGAGCPNDLFLLAGKPSKPRWFVFAPTGGVSIHGAKFVLKPDEALTIGVRSTSEEGFKKDPACSVTWAAQEP